MEGGASGGQPMASSLVNSKYRITRRIGGGSFGEIYMGIGPSNEKVAVKFERHENRCPQLRHEYKVYRELTNCHGFCSVYYFGTQDNYNVMVMDLLGPSLEDLFNKCSRRFSLKTVLQIADQLLERVDTLHSRHLIHRDIKPANFVIGLGEQGANVFCVDFGLSKRYRHPKNLQHIPHRDGRSLTGTPRYASINNHLGIEQSRRDDLESIGYVLIYFLKGTLPWQGLKAKNAQKKYRMILEKKQQVSIAQLAQGCPSQFAEFLAYTRSLKFDAKPDFPYLRKLFRDLYHQQGCANVGKLWDWDDIDNDYAVMGEAAPPGPLMMNPNAHRPSTAAAVAATGIDTDAMILGDEFDMSRGKSDRPTTAGAVGTRATSSWGYSQQQQQQQQQSGSRDLGQSRPVDPRSGDVYHTEPSRARPHTAHAGFTSGPSQGDPRAAKAAAVPPGEEDDAHVVAGARAMMRYRRTRASSAEGGSNGPPGPGPQSQGQSGAAQGQIKGWTAETAGYNNAGSAQSGSRAQPGQMQQMMQQQQQQLQQQAQRKASATATSTQSGWIGGPPTTQDRPKSASATGIMSSLTGGGRGGPQPQPQTAPSASALSYGSLKNRFLSGTAKPTDAAPQGGQSGGAPSSAAQPQKAASKLFSLSR